MSNNGFCSIDRRVLRLTSGPFPPSEKPRKQLNALKNDVIVTERLLLLLQLIASFFPVQRLFSSFRCHLLFMVLHSTFFFFFSLETVQKMAEVATACVTTSPTFLTSRMQRFFFFFGYTFSIPYFPFGERKTRKERPSPTVHRFITGLKKKKKRTENDHETWEELRHVSQKKAKYFFSQVRNYSAGRYSAGKRNTLFSLANYCSFCT